MRDCPCQRGRRGLRTAENLAKKGGRDGEMCDEGHENGAVLGLAPPGGPIESLSQEALMPFGMRIGMHWRPVSVFFIRNLRRSQELRNLFMIGTS